MRAYIFTVLLLVFTTFNCIGQSLSAMPAKEANKLEKQSRIENRDSYIAALAQKEDLHYIDLSGLELTTLPEVIRQFDEIITLDLRNNQLSTLPDWLASKSTIKNLDISDNQFEEIPAVVFDMRLYHVSLQPKWTKVT